MIVTVIAIVIMITVVKAQMSHNNGPGQKQNQNFLFSILCKSAVRSALAWLSLYSSSIDRMKACFSFSISLSLLSSWRRLVAVIPTDCCFCRGLNAYAVDLVVLVFVFVVTTDDVGVVILDFGAR